MLPFDCLVTKKVGEADIISVRGICFCIALLTGVKRLVSLNRLLKQVGIIAHISFKIGINNIHLFFSGRFVPVAGYLTIL